MDARLNGAHDPRRADFSNPIYDPVRPALARLSQEPGWPDAGRLNLLAKELGVAPHTASGMPVRFAHPRPESMNYELRVHASGEVSTRPRNWHHMSHQGQIIPSDVEWYATNRACANYCQEIHFFALNF